MINGSATDAFCPCCSLEHEDQDHMFQCQSKQTRDATKPGIVITETAYHRDNILPAVTKKYQYECQFCEGVTTGSLPTL